MIFIASYQKKKSSQQNTVLINPSDNKRRHSQSVHTAKNNQSRKKAERINHTTSGSSNQSAGSGDYRRVPANGFVKTLKVQQKSGDYKKANKNTEKKDSWMISPIQSGRISAAASNTKKRTASKGGAQRKRKSLKKQLNPMTKFVLMVIAGIVILVLFIEAIAAIRHSRTKGDTAKYSSSSSTITSPVSEEQDQQSESTYPEGTDPLTLGSMTQLVNKTHGLPTDYEPSDLVKNELPGMRDTYLRSEAATALSELFDAAESAGASLICCSGYRSYESQTEVYASEVANLGEYEAYMTTAPPGYSEHQTGLCIDVTSDSVNQTLTTDFINTAEGKWLDENAWRFGFIIRYPNGMEDITGYTYEPWHIRYLGKEVAKAVYESGKTYEEYLGILD